MNKEAKIKSFTDLHAWKKSHALVLRIYDITKQFPKEEMFGLVSQMRRSAVSITSNLAEGFSRRSYKDKAHFYGTALGSLTELQNQLLICKDVDIVSADVFQELADMSVDAHKLINGLIKKSTDIHDS